MKHTRQTAEYTFRIEEKELYDLLEAYVRDEHMELPLGEARVFIYANNPFNQRAVVNFKEKE